MRLWNKSETNILNNNKTIYWRKIILHGLCVVYVLVVWQVFENLELKHDYNTVV